MSDAAAVSRAFPAELASVGAARRFVRNAVIDLPDEHRDGLTLIVSELATNALLHAATSFEVSILRADGIRLDVVDGDPALPEPRTAAPRDVSGRGLALVEQLSSRWGVERRAGGKCVWCELDLPGS